MVFHAGCRVKTQRFGPCKISSSTVSTVPTYILVVGIHAPITINGPFSNGVQNKTTPVYYNSQILGRINKHNITGIISINANSVSCAAPNSVITTNPMTIELSEITLENPNTNLLSSIPLSPYYGTPSFGHHNCNETITINNIQYKLYNILKV